MSIGKIGKYPSGLYIFYNQNIKINKLKKLFSMENFSLVYKLHKKRKKKSEILSRPWSRAKSVAVTLASFFWFHVVS